MEKWLNKQRMLDIVIILLLASTLYLMFKAFFVVFIPEQSISDQSSRRWHFFIIAPNAVDPYWEQVKKGVYEAARLYHVDVEWRSPRFNNLEEQWEYMDIAILSKVDGIITQVNSHEKWITLIDKAYKQNIPVVTIDSDAPESKRIAFVGYNGYQLGEVAGQMMAQATNKKANIIAIINDQNDTSIIQKNLNLSGFLNAIRNYPQLHVIDIKVTKWGGLSVEEIAQSALYNQKQVDAFYLSDEINTIGLARVIVDLNMVGKVKVIGHGYSDEIKRYIEKGVITGTVMSDPYRIGFDSIKTMIDIKQDIISSTIIDTGIRIYPENDLMFYNIYNRQKDIRVKVK